MGTALDIIVIVIVAIFAFLGYRKGLAETGVSVAGTIISTILTMALSTPIAEAIYKGGFRMTILEKAQDATKLFKQSGQGNLGQSILKTMPKFIGNSFSGFGVSNDKFAEAAAKGPEQVEQFLAPIVISFISVFVSIGLFIVLFIVVRVLSKVIGNTIDVFGAGGVDSFLGAVVGIIEGFVVVVLIAFVVRISVPHIKEPPELFSDESISQSTVFRGVYDSSTLTQFIKSSTKSPNTESVKK